MAITENKRMEEFFYMGESGLIKFAKTVGDPSCERLSVLEGIPNTYVEYIADLKSREIINEVGVKIIKDTLNGEENKKILGSSIIYFMIAETVAGRVSNYLAVTSGGLFQNSIIPSEKYTSRDDISLIEATGDGITITRKNGRATYITIATRKKIKVYNEQIASLLRYLYFEAPRPESTQVSQENTDGSDAQTNYEQTNNNSDATIYHLVSSRGVTRGLVHGMIESKVYFADDHMEIATSPKRLNTLPVINYSDITSVKKNMFFSWYSVVVAILFAAFCILGQVYMLLFSAVMLYLGINHRITITLRNGAITKLYSHKKKYADMCLADIQKRMSQGI